MAVRKVGFLTSGGCAAGLNPSIAGFLQQIFDIAKESGDTYEIYFFDNGWDGLLNKNYKLITTTGNLESQVSNAWDTTLKTLANSPGSILGNSRVNLAKNNHDFKLGVHNYNALGLDCLVAEGGDDTLGLAAKLAEAGVNMIGGPKTMDMDLNTALTYGAASAAKSLCDHVREFSYPTASHGRIGIVGALGATSGWSVLAAMAFDKLEDQSRIDAVVIPEVNVDYDMLTSRIVEAYHRKGYAMMIVAEGVAKQGMEEGGFGRIKVSAPDAAKLVRKNLEERISPVSIMSLEVAKGRDYIDDHLMPTKRAILEHGYEESSNNFAVVGDHVIFGKNAVLLASVFQDSGQDDLSSFIKQNHMVIKEKTGQYFIEAIPGGFAYNDKFTPDQVVRGMMTGPDMIFGIAAGRSIAMSVANQHYGTVPELDLSCQYGRIVEGALSKVSQKTPLPPDAYENFGPSGSFQAQVEKINGLGFFRKNTPFMPLYHTAAALLMPGCYEAGFR